MTSITPQELRAFRRAYAIPKLYPCPRIGNAQEANVILAFSFGRDMFRERHLGDQLAELGAHRGSSDLQIFDRLEQLGFKPGKPNQDIAAAVWTEIHHPDRAPRKLTAIAQWEVAYAMWESNPLGYRQHWPRIKAVWPAPGCNKFHTHKVLQQCLNQASVLRPLYLTVPIIVAHEVHLPRVIAIAWKNGIPAVTSSERISSWDKSSTQRHTRNVVRCVPREVAARLGHHLLKRLVKLSPPPEHREPDLFSV